MCQDDGRDHVADRRWTVCQDGGMTGDGQCVRMTVEIM